MDKKIKFIIVLLPVVFSLAGATSLYNKYDFYKNAYKAEGTIINISETQSCKRRYKSCKYGKDVTVSFTDYKNHSAVITEELSTITMISGSIVVGDKVKILYVPNNWSGTLLDSLSPVKNLGPLNYDNASIYIWHYWAYPFIWVLLGPISYLLFKRIEQDTLAKKRKQEITNF